MLKNIQKIKETSNPRAILFRSFFDTKYGELADVFKNYGDKGVFKLLIQLDQAHQNAYEEAARGE